jgi:hypothetical protein
MGHFSEDSLQKFNAMCAEGVDFGESPVYDFARCIKKDGEIYGISPGEVCKEGRQISDKKEVEPKKDVSGRMAKLKEAFIRKIGREMTSAEIEKARNMIAKIGVPIPEGESAESMLQKMIPKGEKVHKPTREA